MNEQNKKRLIGAGALVAVALVAVWIIKILATPADTPDGESVRVYEILPNGQARAVNAEGEKSSSENGDKKESRAEQEPGVTSAIAKPAAQSASKVAEKPADKPEDKQAEKPKTVAEKPKSASKPEAQAAAETPPREVLAPNASTSSKPQTSAPASKPATTQAAKPAPKPAPAAQPDITAGDWVVQVGSFGEQDNADRVVEKLSPRFPAQVSRAVVNGKTYYRVQTGPYDSEAKAKAAEKKLQGQGYGARAMQSP